MSTQKMWICPDGSEIEFVLVCGGELEKDKPNTYFQMLLDGTYSHRFANGSIGVPNDCHDHADGGCCMEPNCPECHSECVQVDVIDNSSFRESEFQSEYLKGDMNGYWDGVNSGHPLFSGDQILGILELKPELIYSLEFIQEDEVVRYTINGEIKEFTGVFIQVEGLIVRVYPLGKDIFNFKLK